MKKFLLLFVALLGSISGGCTNVTGGALRTITPPESSTLATTSLITAATDFFTGVDYQCNTERDGNRLRCRKDLRDLYIHQTHAVVEIFQGDQPGSHLLVTTRWDEGMIPGELIASEFSNDDVQLFCDHLQAQGLGGCEVGPSGG